MENKRKILLYFGILLLLFNYLFSISQILQLNEIVSTIIMFIGCFLMLVSSFLKKSEHYLNKIIFLLIALVVYFISRQSDILQLFIIMTCLKNENVDSIINFIYKVILTFVLFHIFAYIIIYIYDKTSVSFNTRFDINILRHKFLFTHANVFGLLLCWLNTMKLYFERNNIKVSTIILTIINIIFIIVFPNSRTSFIVLAILLVTLVGYKIIPKILKKFMKNSIQILFLISVIFMLLYPNNSIVQKIDESFSSRIKLGYVALDYYGIKLFGQNIEFLSETDIYWEYGLTSFTLDSVYYKSIFSYGLAITSILLIYIYFRTKKVKEEDNICCFILAYSAAASMESVVIFPLIAFVPLLLINLEEKKDE